MLQKKKDSLIVLKILYYLQENINSKTLQFFIDYENEVKNEVEKEVKMDLCTGEEFNKDTFAKIKRLIEYCEEQIKGFYLNLKILNEELKKITSLHFLPMIEKIMKRPGIPSWLYETTSSQKGIRRCFDSKEVDLVHLHLLVRNYRKILLRNYENNILEILILKMIKYSYKQNIKKLVNLYKPKLSEYDKEYIRLWNLSGNSRKSIITDKVFRKRVSIQC